MAANKTIPRPVCSDGLSKTFLEKAERNLPRRCRRLDDAALLVGEWTSNEEDTTMGPSLMESFDISSRERFDEDADIEDADRFTALVADRLA